MINNKFQFSSINCLNICLKFLTTLIKQSSIWKEKLKSDENVTDFKLYKSMSPIQINEHRLMYYQIIKNRTLENFLAKFANP